MIYDDVEDNGSSLIVRIPDSKTKISRAFVVDGNITNDNFRKYFTFRSSKIEHRLLITHKSGKCSVQPVGNNKLPKITVETAKFLGKQNAENLTRHSLQQGSATLLADSGVDF